MPPLAVLSQLFMKDLEGSTTSGDATTCSSEGDDEYYDCQSDGGGDELDLLVCDLDSTVPPLGQRPYILRFPERIQGSK